MQACLGREDEGGRHDQDEPFDLEAEQGQPVEEGDEFRTMRSVARPVDGEHGRAGVGPLQAAESDEEPRQVPDDDQAQRLGEAEAETHQDGAVHEVLDVDAGAGPQAGDVTGSRPPLALGDEVDPVVLDVEGLILRRQVFRAGCGGRPH
jgi:hypothetical protein